jgi:ubiquinone/menaquinone biosynthesis C-methylase UbiE
MTVRNFFTITEVRSFWDNIADHYDHFNEKVEETHHQRFKQAISYLSLKPGHRILNVWSRTGLLIPYLREKCHQASIYNFEVSSRFIEIARRKFPEEAFHVSDLNRFDFADEFFDCIVSLETLEHTPEPDVFLGELRRVLKRGGLLVMSLPPQTAEVAVRISELLGIHHGEGPHQFLSSKVVKGLLKEAGFHLIEHRGTLLIPAGPHFLRRWGERIIDRFQHTLLSELGIRQFYICTK